MAVWRIALIWSCITLSLRLLNQSLANQPAANAASAPAPRAAALQSRVQAVEDTLHKWFKAELPRLQQSSSTFSDIAQAQAVLRLLRDELLPAYRQFHSDLLFHQQESSLFRPLRCWHLQ